MHFTLWSVVGVLVSKISPVPGSSSYYLIFYTDSLPGAVLYGILLRDFWVVVKTRSYLLMPLLQVSVDPGSS